MEFRMSKGFELLLLLVLAGTLAAQVEQRLENVSIGSLETAIPFEGPGQIPEGVVMDNAGNLFVSLAPLGQIWKFGPFGNRTLIASLATPPFPGPGVLGLEVDVNGNVYVAVASLETDSRGVWRISPDGTTTRLPGTEAISWPNGLAFDELGNLYVTDSVQITPNGILPLGRIWRIPEGGGTPCVWSDNRLLNGQQTPFIAAPVGANGIAYRHGRLFVANTTTRQVVEILILPNGNPGDAFVLANMDSFLPPEVVPPLGIPVPPLIDGLTLDGQGNLYVAVIGQHKLVRLLPDASSLSVLANYSDGLRLPASPAFGTTRGTRTTLFVTNFVFLPGLDNPAVMNLDVGIPGQPVIGALPPD